MSMFNMGGVKEMKSPYFLPAGIHKVTFEGIDKAEGFEALELRFKSVNGPDIHNERIFAPRSEERTTSQFGTNPSEAEQFMCKIKQVIDALDPELGKKIETEGDKFAAPDFNSFIALLKKYLDKKVGTTTEIKLLPTTGSFVGFPLYPAKINRDGNLYMGTKIIGTNLTLSAREKTAIDAAQSAKPTPMSRKDDELADLRKDFEREPEDDLPF